jgi:hypothetical protein
MDYMKIGAAYTATAEQRANLESIIASMTWLDVDSTPTLPLCPGMAIKTAIKEFRIPKVSKVAHDGLLGNYAVLGIEGNYSEGAVRIFLLDRGSDLMPICAQHANESNNQTPVPA